MIDQRPAACTVGRVLVVDDDVATLAFIADALVAHGYAVVKAETGRDALRAVMLQRPRPNLVLLALRLPDMDGWSVARLIRVSVRNLPIVAMTAAARHSWGPAAVDADAFLAKPVDLNELVSLVGRYCPPPPRSAPEA